MRSLSKACEVRRLAKRVEEEEEAGTLPSNHFAPTNLRWPCNHQHPTEKPGEYIFHFLADLTLEALGLHPISPGNLSHLAQGQILTWPSKHQHPHMILQYFANHQNNHWNHQLQ